MVLMSSSESAYLVTLMIKLQQSERLAEVIFHITSHVIIVIIKRLAEFCVVVSLAASDSNGHDFPHGKLQIIIFHTANYKFVSRLRVVLRTGTHKL